MPCHMVDAMTSYVAYIWIYMPIKYTLISTYYCLTWCRLFNLIEIQSQYIQPKLNTFTVFGAEISSQYRPKVNRNMSK